MSKEVDIVVIGGGLAGLSAALTGARLGRATALLTGGLVGGQLVTSRRSKACRVFRTACRATISAR